MINIQWTPAGKQYVVCILLVQTYNMALVQEQQVNIASQSSLRLEDCTVFGSSGAQSANMLYSTAEAEICKRFKHKIPAQVQ